LDAQKKTPEQLGVERLKEQSTSCLGETYAGLFYNKIKAIAWFFLAIH